MDPYSVTMIDECLHASERLAKKGSEEEVLTTDPIGELRVQYSQSRMHARDPQRVNFTRAKFYS